MADSSRADALDSLARDLGAVLAGPAAHLVEDLDPEAHAELSAAAEVLRARARQARGWRFVGDGTARLHRFTTDDWDGAEGPVTEYPQTPDTHFPS